MGAEAYKDFIEFGLTRPSPADVADDTLVTPISRFVDDVWRFPPEWLPANRKTLIINHNVGMNDHYCLLRKNILLAEMRLTGGGWGRKKQPKPKTLTSDASVLKTAFLAFQKEGYGRLDEVPASLVHAHLSRYKNKEKERREGFFLFINQLFDKGIIADHFAQLIAAENDTDESSYLYNDVAVISSEEGTWLPIPDDDLLILIRTAGHIIQVAGPTIIKAYDESYQIGIKLTDEKGKSVSYHALKMSISNRRSDALLNTSWPKLELQTERSWPPKNTRDLTFWVNALQASVYSIVGIQIGGRDSEMQSIHGTSWTKAKKGQWYLDNTIWKTSASFGGTDHRVPVNEDAVDALEIQKQLFDVAGKHGVETPGLFFGLQGGVFNAYERLVDLSEIAAIDKVHSHQFRKTLARLVALAIVDSPKILQELFGHADLEMTLTYIMALPGMDEELREAVTSTRRNRAGSIYDEVNDAGGGGADPLRNIIRDLQADVANNSGHNSQQEVASEARNRFIEQVLRGGLGLKQVAPGVVCLKAPIQNGFCATKKGELNAGQCQIGCPHHIELSERKDAVTDTIWWLMDELQKEGVATNPLLRKHYRRQLAEYVAAWPELKRKYGDHPVVMAALDEARKVG